MVQEYLVVDSDQIELIKQYKHDGVTSNISLLGDDKGIIISFAINSNSETAARRLSVINDYVVKNYKVTTLQNGCAAYFNEKLYPWVSRFECKLRKLLYLAAAINPSKEAEQNISDLEKKDFGKLFEILFVDSDFIKGAKTLINNNPTDVFLKELIVASINTLNEKSLWNKLLGETVVPTLKKRLMDVRGYRNDVMHSHYINFESYNEILKLYKTLIDELDKAIFSLSGDTVTENNSDFNETLHQALSKSDSDMSSVSYPFATLNSNQVSGINNLFQAIRLVSESYNKDELLGSLRQMVETIQKAAEIITNAAPASLQQPTEE